VLAISVPLRSFEENARATRRPYEILLLLALLGLLASLVMLVSVEPGLAPEPITGENGA
jgi:hypothetical protein